MEQTPPSRRDRRAPTPVPAPARDAVRRDAPVGTGRVPRRLGGDLQDALLTALEADDVRRASLASGVQTGTLVDEDLSQAVRARRSGVGPVDVDDLASQTPSGHDPHGSLSRARDAHARRGTWSVPGQSVPGQTSQTVRIPDPDRTVPGSGTARGEQSASTSSVSLDFSAARTAPAFVEQGRLRFVTERPLGRGGMAEVWEGREVATGRRVALKTIRPESLHKPRVRARFAYEAALTARVRHPNVVGCDGLRTTDDGVEYLVLELLEGENLKQRMRRQGEVGPRLAIGVALQLLRGLEAAHRAGVVHRDVKPSNVMLVPDEQAGVPQVKLVDFGLSELMDARAEGIETPQGRTLGTPAYVSPEQALGEASDARSDVYSVCALLYELLTGVRLFRARTVNHLVLKHLHEAPVHLRERAPWISEAVADVVMRGLSKHRERRQASAGQLSRELAQAMRPEGRYGLRRSHPA